MTRKWLMGAVTGGGLLMLSLWGAWEWFFHRALPDYNADATVAGLTAEVEILRDGDGVAHIFAENLSDLLFAQGYAHAQDRFFTMDFYRHIARGELHRIAGTHPDVIENDRFMQTMRIAALAEEEFQALSPEAKRLLWAFTNGINAYINDQKPGRVALEYSVLGFAGRDIAVMPWRPEDSLAISKLVGFSMSGRDLTRELDRAAVLDAVGPEMYAQWRPAYDYTRHPVVLKGDVIKTTVPKPLEGQATISPTVSDGGLASRTGIERYGLAPEGAGSNAFALSGALTKSGRPLIAVDPHAALEIPNIWHEIGLNLRPPSGDNISVYGWVAAPFFLVLEGKNDYGAWGTTNVTGGDPFDLFILTVNPNNSGQYLWNDEWLTFTKTPIHLPGANGQMETTEADWTHFGPVVSPPGADTVLAARWGGFEGGKLTEASLALPFSRTFEEMRQALEGWDYPPTHFVWAGKDGSIGIQQAGRFPYRIRGHSGQLPHPATGDKDDWPGMIAYADMPYGVDPSSGFIATGNNPIKPPSYFDELGQRANANANYLKDVARGYRGARLEALIEAHNHHDAASAKRIQTDVKVFGLKESLANIDWDLFQEQGRCVALLTDWSGKYGKESAGALVFAHLWSAILDKVYKPHLPDSVSVNVGMAELLSLETILADPNSGWWDNPKTDRRENQYDRLADIIPEVCSTLENQFGDDIAAWQWGDVHQAAFVAPVLGQSGISFLERAANREGILVPGGSGTISVSRWKHGAGYSPVHIPGYRMVFDWGNPDEMFLINSVGQSSHVASPHYTDQQEKWAANVYRKVTLTEDIIRSRVKHRQVLRPEGAIK